MTTTSLRYALATAALLALTTGHAAAQDAPDIAQVKATTQKLINLLVEQGVLTRARAEGLLAEIERPAAAPRTPAPAGAAPAAAAPPPVRVQLVPEFVRKELKEEIRNEVMAQGLRDGWAAPGSVPDWVRGLRVEGDLRARYQFDNYGEDNAPALSITETNRTRALTLANTSEDRQRLRVRARLGVTATLDENWGGGVRLTTGSTADPISSNQTLGTYGNRFTAAFDRAYVRYRHGSEFNAVFGRFGNPWFGTELVWANDLGFDGIAAQWTPSFGPRLRGFATAALMPVQEVELSSADKWLAGLQIGAEFPGNPGGLRGKLGLGFYQYRNIVGQANAAGSSLNDFTAPAFAQKGNTYFNISSDANRPLLALAADYKLVNLTGSLELPLDGGRVLSFTGDFVRNTGFDRAEVAARVGSDVEAQTKGWLVRAVFGQADVARRGDWQVFAGYKRVERDAVLDAFTDSDLRLGGTDAKGFSIGGSLGLGRSSTLSLRYLSGDSISGAPLSIDVLQLDLNARF